MGACIFEGCASAVEALVLHPDEEPELGALELPSDHPGRADRVVEAGKSGSVGEVHLEVMWRPGGVRLCQLHEAGEPQLLHDATELPMLQVDAGWLPVVEAVVGLEARIDRGREGGQLVEEVRVAGDEYRRPLVVQLLSDVVDEIESRPVVGFR